MPESVITSFDVASSSQAVVFGDSLGSLHLFTSGSKPTFNNFSQVGYIIFVIKWFSHMVYIYNNFQCI